MSVVMPPPAGVVILNDDDRCLQLPHLESGEGVIRAVVWPGVGAHKRSMHRFSLNGAARTIIQRHPSESVYYVIRGAATVIDESERTAHQVIEGSMVHITPNTSYRFVAGDTGAELVGGPCPPDPDLYRHLE